jgi:hypothetical protein
VTAQREIVNSLQAALDARRQRILISRSSLNWVKSAGILVQAICTLFAIAMVHSDNRLSAALAVGRFTTAAAVCLVMIVAHNRPFTEEISVRPEVCYCRSSRKGGAGPRSLQLAEFLGGGVSRAGHFGSHQA